MAIKGDLREASLPDVLQLLAMGGKSGCLSVTNRRHFGYIYFDAGRICYASIVNRRDRLGDLLVKNGLVVSDQLSAALDEQARSPDLRIGEILIARGAITREQLEHYTRVQIEEAVYFLFTWTQGSFFFEADQAPEEGAMLVSIHPENLLLEGARRVDEWSLIEKKIPSLELVFAVDRSRVSAGDLELSEEQRRMLPLLDGRFSVAEIVDRLGLVEFEAGKAVYGLIQAGLAECVGRRDRVAKEEGHAARILEHRNLGVAFYRTGLHEEAIREFHRVLELEPGNREARFLLALNDLRRGAARDAARSFRQLLQSDGSNVSTLLNFALALERMGRQDTALAATEEALRLDPRHGAARLSRAILLLKLRRAREAQAAFHEYRAVLGEQTTPPAAYFAFAALAAAIVGQLDEAVQLGEQGLRTHPHNAHLLLRLGAIHERRGDWEAAESLYRRACEEDAALPQAHKALGDALYRRGAAGEAAEAYRYAVQLDAGLGDDVYFRLGNLAYKVGDRAEAVRLWRRALELNPHNEVVRTNLEVVESVICASSERMPASSSPPEKR